MQGTNGSNEFQEFNGKKYWKDFLGYYCNYFDGKTNRLHRDVWEFHKGTIPEGYIVHHKDGDISNNSIENLAAMLQSEHASFHNGSDENKIHIKEKLLPEMRKYWDNGATKEHRKFLSDKAKARWKTGVYGEKEIFECVVCGKEYKTYRKFVQRGFCSARCKSAARYQSKTDFIERDCVVCNTKFSAYKYGKAKTCSKECMAEAIRKTMLGKKRSGKKPTEGL